MTCDWMINNSGCSALVEFIALLQRYCTINQPGAKKKQNYTSPGLPVPFNTYKPTYIIKQSPLQFLFTLKKFLWDDIL